MHGRAGPRHAARWWPSPHCHLARARIDKQTDTCGHCADASCGPAEATKITDCQKALESPKSSGDQLKKDTCTYVKEMMECFPKDCCTDKKADVDRILADHRANLETTCDTDCGPHDEHDRGSEASTGSRLPASHAPLAAVAVALAASSRLVLV